MLSAYFLPLPAPSAPPPTPTPLSSVGHPLTHPPKLKVFSPPNSTSPTFMSRSHLSLLGGRRGHERKELVARNQSGSQIQPPSRKSPGFPKPGGANAQASLSWRWWSRVYGPPIPRSRGYSYVTCSALLRSEDPWRLSRPQRRCNSIGPRQR